MNRILHNSDIQAKLTAMGAIARGGSAEDFSKFAASELKRYEAIVRDSGMRKE